MNPLSRAQAANAIMDAIDSFAETAQPHFSIQPISVTVNGATIFVLIAKSREWEIIQGLIRQNAGFPKEYVN